MDETTDALEKPAWYREMVKSRGRAAYPAVTSMALGLAGYVAFDQALLAVAGVVLAAAWGAAVQVREHVAGRSGALEKPAWYREMVKSCGRAAYPAVTSMALGLAGYVAFDQALLAVAGVVLAAAWGAAVQVREHVAGRSGALEKPAWYPGDGGGAGRTGVRQRGR